MMYYCPVNVSLSELWVDHGLSRCFMDTASYTVMGTYMGIVGMIQLVIYGKYGTPVDPSFRPRSSLYVLQLCLHFFIPALTVVWFILQATFLDDKTIYGHMLLALLVTIVVWPLAGTILLVERNERLPSIPTSGHGAVLLIFWSLAFIHDNLLLLNLWKTSWWFKLETVSDKVEVSMYAFHYTATFLVFVIGIKAPGVTRSFDQEQGQPILSDGETPAPNRGSTFSSWRSKIRTLVPYIWPKKSFLLQINVIFCFILLISGRIGNILVPLFNKEIINSLSYPVNGKLSFRWDLILYLVLVKFLQGGGTGTSGFINNLRSFLWIKVQQYTSLEVQVSLFHHLHTLSLRWHVGRKTGEVLRVMDRGTNSINTLLSYILFNILPTIADIFIAVVYMALYFNGYFGLIIFLTMLLYLVVTIGITEWRTKYRRTMNQKDNEARAIGVDSLLNYETVKYHGAESYEVRRYTNILKQFQVEEWKSTASLNLLNTVQNVSISCGLLAGCLLCADMVVKNELTVGDFVLFTTYITQLYIPLNWFGTYYRMIQQSFIDMENMFDLLNEKPEVEDSPHATSLRMKQGGVVFENVGFHYRSDYTIYNDLSFTVPPGSTVALVGPTGAGKTTVTRLLFRFYDCQQGSILIDGQDVKSVTQESLRANIGVVPQDTVLFNDTIRHNIGYGREDATDEDIIKAAQAADIHEKITTFPDGYDTIVGERGLKLSGGEKQRVAIARMILKAPKLLVLDEATSSLDTHTERNIQAALNRLCAGRTSIVVAHRLSTVVNATQILVLKEGEIVERGTHEELLQLGKVYADMWQDQTKEDST